MSFLEKLNKPFLVVGRVLYALPFLGFGINQFIKTQKYEAVLPDFVPWPTFWVYFTGVAFILTAISMIVNYKAKYASLLLSFMLIIFLLILFIPNFMQSKTYVATYSIFIGGALMVYTTSKN